MDFTYDIVTAKSDKKAQIGIHICHTINTIIELFISTFLIAHIYSFSNGIYDYIFKAATYEIISYFTMLFVYFLASKIVNLTNRVSTYRLSTIIWAIFLVFAIFYGEQMAKYLWLAGILCGISRGVYWSSFNVLKQEMVGKSNMKNFATFSMVLQKTVNVVFPITLGALIDKTTYSSTAIVVLAFCLVQIGCSFLIKSKHPANSDFKMLQYFKRLKEKNELNARLKFLYGMCFVYGTNTAVSTLINISIMIQFGSNSSLGAITSCVAVAVIITTLLVGKLTKSGKRTSLYLGASIICFLSVVLYVLLPSGGMLILMNFIISICGVVFKLIIDIYRNKFLKEYGRYDDIAEHQCVVESIFQIARALSYAILIIVSLFKSLVAINIAVALFFGFYISNLILLLIFENKFMKQPKVEKVAEN